MFIYILSINFHDYSFFFYIYNFIYFLAILYNFRPSTEKYKLFPSILLLFSTIFIIIIIYLSFLFIFFSFFFPPPPFFSFSLGLLIINFLYFLLWIFSFDITKFISCFQPLICIFLKKKHMKSTFFHKVRIFSFPPSLLDFYMRKY